MKRRPQAGDVNQGIFDWLRDRSYDTVFHVGDTAQEFLWDVVQGPQVQRTGAYHSRILDSSRRRGELSLSFSERQSFEKMLSRTEGESIIEHWKRRKALLQFANKKALVSGYDALEKQKQKLSTQQNGQVKASELKKLETQFKEITSLEYVSSQKHGQK